MTDALITPAAAKVSDGFSCRRLGMVARYYWPMIKWEVILFPVASVLVGLLVWLFIFGKAGTLASMASGILSYGVIFAPLVLMYERKRSYQMSLSLPAANSEKAMFLLLYFCVAVPVLLYLPMKLCTLPMTMDDFLNTIPEMTPELAGQIRHLVLSPATISLGVATSLAYVLTTLWIMVAARRNVLAKAILIPLGINYGLGIVVGMFFGVFAFYIGFKHGYEGSAPDERAVADFLVNIVINCCYVMIVILVAYAGVAAVMVWRAIAKRQL